ncbi:MAG: manganese-dependent inorganic pyrophosphatase, partial [Candidatus Falkowbacteria bacterium]|nr:manganese-dependent inorganic pyrophosphatase [Candidatus Falkowbacteria bacterium]
IKYMSEIIYTISNKSPDLDSVTGAVSYAGLKNIIDPTKTYIPVTAGHVNKETNYVLDKFNLKKPEVLENIAHKNIILVDHNENFQIQDGYEEANIIEVLDHHKISFASINPIQFEVKPWGSSCSIIADKYFELNLKIEKSLASAMLAAILVDTVITKSPTCTDYDREIIKKLAEIADINDWQAYGMEIFKVRSAVGEYSDIDIIKNDFKDFDFAGEKFGIGQIETADITELENRENGLLVEMNKLREEGGYSAIVLFLTDIIKEGSKFLIAAKDEAKIEEALGAKLNNHRVYIDKILSRKKQVIPMLMEKYK